MRAMVLEKVGAPLRRRELPDPVPSAGEVLVRVHACAVCRTDLHVVDGELSEGSLPLIPGHQIVGVVQALGAEVVRPRVGDRVGIPWLASTCGSCRFCRDGQENLCAEARFTGYTRPGGYADQIVADARFCFPLPDQSTDLQAAPLLCAGLIGYRALRMTGEARRLGFYGFGQAAHILVQVARHQGRQVYAFTRREDEAGRQFARSLGAIWAGGSEALPPEPLDAAIIFAPVGALVPAALRAVVPGGTVVCAGIHMSEIPAFPYRLLWEERVLRSVANLTRQDAEEFLAIAPRIPVRTEMMVFPLEAANEALAALREGRISGAAVLTMRS